ncbi:hypothetical protein GCM10027159_08180 [Lysobacter terrae]
MKIPLVILLASIALAGCTQKSNEPAATTQAMALSTEMATLAGPGARSCGVVFVGQSDDAAWGCAEAADKEGLPYWFAVRIQGVDGEMWMGVVRSASGQHFILCDGSIQRTIDVPACQPSVFVETG